MAAYSTKLSKYAGRTIVRFVAKGPRTMLKDQQSFLAVMRDFAKRTISAGLQFEC